MSLLESLARASTVIVINNDPPLCETLLQLVAPAVAVGIAVWGFRVELRRRREARAEDDDRALRRAERLRWTAYSMATSGGHRPGYSETKIELTNTDSQPVYDVTIGPVRLKDGPPEAIWNPNGTSNSGSPFILAQESKTFTGQWRLPDGSGTENLPTPETNLAVVLNWTDADGRRFRRNADGSVEEIRS
ncbi:hypothetical protein ACRAWC_01805 [Leifsonia sp. L25]|uniref:hypothetical protein n=1 Tax=Actinomycetes TaxID=1760 RepID=UPI003D69E2E1